MFEPHQWSPSLTRFVGFRSAFPGQGRKGNSNRPRRPSRSGSPLLPQAPSQPREIEEIVAGYLAGTTARELGEKFEAHRTAVSGILKAHGITMRPHPMQPAEIDHAIWLYESGLSLVKVAEVLHYDQSTIWRHFKQLNVRTRDSHGS